MLRSRMLTTKAASAFTKGLVSAWDVTHSSCTAGNATENGLAETGRSQLSGNGPIHPSQNPLWFRVGWLTHPRGLVSSVPRIGACRKSGPLAVKRVSSARGPSARGLDV